jgi:hypothetical protein
MWKNEIDRPYAARHPLDDAHLPARAAPLPTGEERLPTARRTSYEWKNVFVHAGDAHQTVVCIASPDGVKHVGRSIEHVFRLYEDVRPRGRGASDNRATHGPRWGAARRPTDRARLRSGRTCSSTWKKHVGPTSGAMPPLGRITSADRSRPSSARTSRFFRAHAPRCPTGARPPPSGRRHRSDARVPLPRPSMQAPPTQAGHLRTGARAPPVEGHTSQPRLHCRIRRGLPHSQSGEPTSAGLRPLPQQRVAKARRAVSARKRRWGGRSAAK